ncbi:RhoGAP domain containing protein [Entamoeba histolytica HM-1:IMSS-B]|uniref:RhoGAP domain containing protein n=5 Tax=Entamoeba histolytica TaxID=5759 RepID=C4M3H0_ENTH1|nr:RhoGAP domain containing protein [Entamoeba histolytica HM-1:IMSS]EMD43524.1 RhoGAP domain containing protein [Entamoeba histolytica KU27]EMH74670.1 RhoGAP domain containing protein [Entamoeba histolytica HM-1:IMSS-B]ENY60089.1 RhoGAP domain containing protein [Entamoeba histolytica HM-1:IMSS-A]GAT95851.1 rhogap domain containing protein [Entamoeba histolytica]EAL45396.1 RhoGAP domain containing protein [Entamoeba histolytica HM-1:IMSS]|eukprot:XP_650782.1 RhoGAP domain containing protein [Entamoeba histolytica HM-1:IMSS]
MNSFFRQHKYFGTPLSNIQRRKTGQCDHRIPSLVYLCVMYICEPEHITQQGLFRLSAQAHEIEKVKKIIDQKSCLGSKSILIKAFDKDLGICTAILKKFLYELPTPLIPQTNIKYLRDLNNNPPSASRLFSTLDPAAADILSFILIFLNYITKFSNKNKMNATNLAVCFAPVLTRPSDSTLVELNSIKTYIEILIEHCDKLIPPQLYEVFCVPFKTFWKNDAERQKKIVHVLPQIETSKEIYDYVLQDRLLYHRSDEWKDMTYSQLIQEYEAFKLAASYFLYNQYFVNGKWPEDNTFHGVMMLIDQLKKKIKENESQVQPDCFHSYNISQSEKEIALPNTCEELASFIADIQTEIITIQQRLDQMPDHIILKKNGDIHTLAERKCLIVKQQHCARVNNYIIDHINEILIQLKA